MLQLSQCRRRRRRYADADAENDFVNGLTAAARLPVASYHFFEEKQKFPCYQNVLLNVAEMENSKKLFQI